MTYPLLESRHIVAAIFWVGSIFLVSFVTSSTPMQSDQMNRVTRITELFIGVIWLAGIILVVMGSWYNSTWWHIKVVIVILISALHTFIHRRWKNAGPEGVSTQPAIAYLVLLLTCVVVALVVLKKPV